MQTECGHRFCKFCIERWLSDGKKKCPIDNEDLTVGKMFPDNFAKREILSMKVRCPNRKMGCNTCVELKHVEEHTESCPYHYQPCPNNCQSLVLRKDLEEHLQSECCKRNFICSFCKETMLFELYGDHEIICPARMVPCDLCKEDVMREKIVEHVATTCPHATVKCCFFLLGCHKEIKREKMEKHMKSNVQKHLQLMCCAFGEWDDVLTWPFRGKIVLSVLDQNPVADQRQHAVETLVSKPMLAAFQRPTTHRNHKGFGYMEYVPLEVLDNSTYVVNDTLILKAQVFPEV
ncbi:TRAF6 [Acanthosepion pharaonis]|uniref:TRAF6 n=1 Tax=Acanthosepion pharaonis TaxID=158019 RepID=A0A812CIW8_ACAPH|nr:TRAF6 [Sepia pharaonis]